MEIKTLEDAKTYLLRELFEAITDLIYWNEKKTEKVYESVEKILIERFGRVVALETALNNIYSEDERVAINESYGSMRSHALKTYAIDAEDEYKAKASEAFTYVSNLLQAE